MLSHRAVVNILLLITCACRTPPAPVAMPSPEPIAEPIAEPDPRGVAHATAVAEVARLRAEANGQVMLAPWPGPYGGVPPWDQVKPALFDAAFTTGIALLLAEVEVIATDPSPPTFANTFVPLEDAGRHLDRAGTLFSVLTSSLNTPEVQAVDRTWSPKLAAAEDAITFNDRLFARIDVVYAARAGLSDEQRRLVELKHANFVQAGARLDAKHKADLGRINQELATLFTDFGNKVLADENTWIVIDKPADLAGIPASLRGAYKAAADERKLNDPEAGAANGKRPATKWAVVNTRSSVDPFLTNSSRRALRERVWKAFKQRGDNGDANDTNRLIARIVALRGERAELLGYETHAHWRMFNTMAVDPAKAEALMMRVWPAAVARVKEEVAEMQKIARRDGLRTAFEPWDYLYYAEKVRKAKYALDQDQLKPYFELGNMVKAAFYMGERLYGLSFDEITGKVPGFHADVRVFEVKDKATGAHRGVFYFDAFARANKRSGAWASGYRRHETFLGKHTAIVSNNNNFVRGAPGEPVLISLDDAQTLFHEFGHALHGLLSEVNYPGLGGTPRDFVEYPSQVHEMWVMTRDVLDRFGLHYKTGKPMPQALANKVEASSKFNTGYATVEYLSSAIVDMALHTSKDEAIDPDAFERDTLARIGAPREVAMRHRLPQFNHLFTSDSYSAGYYSYLWSEVMDADTRQAFVEAGNVFDPATAAKLRKFILAPGNTTDRTEAYRQFRGRDPDVKALLEKRGFPVK